MGRFVVAEGYRWDEYPGLRPGRIASGKGDVGRSPRGASHLVEGPDAVETVCGLPRATFPYDFPDRTAMVAPAEPCVACTTAG